jgi:hypothetical protein
MNKTYYITYHKDAAEGHAILLRGFGSIIFVTDQGVHVPLYLVEDNEENKDWILMQVIKGNIHPENRATFDLEKINAGESFNFHIKEYMTSEATSTFINECILP